MSSIDYSFSGVQNETEANKVAFVLRFIGFDVWVLKVDKICHLRSNCCTVFSFRAAVGTSGGLLQLPYPPPVY